MKPSVYPGKKKLAFYVFLALFLMTASLTSQEDNDLAVVPVPSLYAKENVSEADIVQQSSALLRQADTLLWVDADRAIRTLTEAVRLAEASEDPVFRAGAFLAMSKAYDFKKDRDSILFWADKAESLYEEAGEERGMAEIYYQWGYADYVAGDFEAAIEHILNGLEIMERQRDVAGIALGHLRLTRIFHFSEKMERSAEYGVLAAEGFEKVGDLINAADAWSFAGHGYRMEQEMDSARECFYNNLGISKKLGLPIPLTQAYNDLGFYYGENGIPDSAVYYHRLALTSVPASEPRLKMIIHNTLGQTYLVMEEYDSSIFYSKLALEHVYKTDDVFFLSEIPEYLGKAYAAKSQYDSAYKYMEINHFFTDSLFKAAQSESIENLRVRYETDKKEQIIARQQTERIYGGIILFVLVLLAGLLYYGYKNKQKVNAALEEKNAQNELLLKEIHHRVKNNLEIVSSLLTLQSRQISTPEVQHAMRESQSRVQSMGILHQKLYQGKNLAAIEMKDYFINLSEGVLETFDADDRIKIECVMDQLELDVDTAVPIGLIVNELLTNAMKYAFPEGRMGRIAIRMEEVDGNTLHLKVSDDGVGISSEQTVKGTGFGSQLIQLLTRQLNGRMEQQAAKGTVFSFYFKKSEAA